MYRWLRRTHLLMEGQVWGPESGMDKGLLRNRRAASLFTNQLIMSRHGRKGTRERSPESQSEYRSHPTTRGVMVTFGAKLC